MEDPTGGYFSGSMRSTRSVGWRTHIAQLRATSGMPSMSVACACTISATGSARNPDGFPRVQYARKACPDVVRRKVPMHHAIWVYR